MKDDGDFHLQLYASSAAPKKDYHGLTITSDYIILNSWDISRGTHVYPRRRRICLENFSWDKAFCSEVRELFGSHIVDYANRVAEKDNTLYSVPEKVFRKIIGYLAVGDIVRLGQSSKVFFELCNTNAIWKIIFRKKIGRPPSKTELDVSQAMSWRHMLHRRVIDKREVKKISENFTRDMKKLQEQTKKEAQKIRQSSKDETPVSFERKPPEDKPRKKIQIKTFKATDPPPPQMSGSAQRNPSDKTKKTTPAVKTKAEVSRKKPESIERKVEIDQQTKSSHSIRKSVPNTVVKDKDKKMNKCAKDIQNLKSKSLFL